MDGINKRTHYTPKHTAYMKGLESMIQTEIVSLYFKSNSGERMLPQTSCLGKTPRYRYGIGFGFRLELS